VTLGKYVRRQSNYTIIIIVFTFAILTWTFGPLRRHCGIVRMHVLDCM